MRRPLLLSALVIALVAAPDPTTPAPAAPEAKLTLGADRDGAVLARQPRVLAVPMADAVSIYRWIEMGDRIDVYR